MGIAAPLGVAAAGLPNLKDEANAVVSDVISAVGPSAPFAFRGPFSVALWAAINTTLTTTADDLTAVVGSASGLAAGDAVNSKLVPPGTTIAAPFGTDVGLLLPPITLWGYLDAQGDVTGLPSTDGLLGATATIPSTAERAALPSGTTVASITTAATPATSASPNSVGSPGTPGAIKLSAAPTLSPADRVAIPLVFARTANAILTGAADTAALFTGAAIGYSGSVQLEKSYDGGSTWIVCNTDQVGTLAVWATGTPVVATFVENEQNVLYRLNATALSSGSVFYRISQTGQAARSLSIGRT